MRYIALDLGDRRTGAAAGDSHTRLASPLDTIEVPIDRDGGRALLDAIAALVDAHVGPRDALEIVVGLPLNMDDTEGPRAALAREFAERLAARLGRTVRLHDERLTSAAADWSMARTGLTRGQKKSRRDALAAAELLKSYLATLPPPHPNTAR